MNLDLKNELKTALLVFKNLKYDSWTIPILGNYITFPDVQKASNEIGFTYQILWSKVKIYKTEFNIEKLEEYFTPSPAWEGKQIILSIRERK